MGLGGLVGRDVLGGLESESWDSESPDEGDQWGELRPPGERGGSSGAIKWGAFQEMKTKIVGRIITPPTGAGGQ